MIIKMIRLFVISGLIFSLSIIGVLGCGSEPAADPIEPEEDFAAEEIVDESKMYDGAFKFAGEAVLGTEGLKILIDPSVGDDEARGNYTDITITENMTDYDGNIFTPGIYEFQFVEFPEETNMGAWYIYINDETRISGNPKASDSGTEYDLKVGDIVSIEFWTIATFYKVAE